jgi:predicted dinucleotide-binding enzyme
MAKITVLGSGGWGMALAISAYNNRNDVTLWSPFQEEVDLLLEKRTNEKLLRGVVLPEGIKITTDMSVVEGDTLTIIATPSIAVRSVAKQLSSYKNVGIVVNVSKGFEKGSLKFLTEVISEELPKSKVVALSGPSHAEEVARNIPTSIVATSNSVVAAQTVQDIMSGGCLRVYTSTDLVGVELGIDKLLRIGVLDRDREHQRSTTTILCNLAGRVRVTLHKRNNTCRGECRVQHWATRWADVREVVTYATATLHQLHLLLIHTEDTAV